MDSMKNQKHSFKLLRETMKQSCTGNCNLSLTTLQSGIYLVNLYVNDQLVSTKKLAILK